MIEAQSQPFSRQQPRSSVREGANGLFETAESEDDNEQGSEEPNAR